MVGSHTGAISCSFLQIGEQCGTQVHSFFPVARGKKGIPSDVGQTFKARFTGQHHTYLGRINTQKTESEAIGEPDVDGISVVGFNPDTLVIFRKIGQ